jgi:hypothetical protein
MIVSFGKSSRHVRCPATTVVGLCAFAVMSLSNGTRYR